jgi:hypothetical protein
MVKRRQTLALLALILILAAAFRLYGLAWDDGLRNYPHPDERHLANTMTRVSIPRPVDWNVLLNDPDHSPLNPRRLVAGQEEEHYDLAYGTLPVYLYRATAVLLARIVGNPALDSYDGYRMIGRGITALFSLLTIYWAYGLGQRTFGVPTALLGAALLAGCVLHIQLSHFMTVDLIMSALTTAGLLFAVRFAQNGRTGDAVGMGVLLGLSMASKFNGITLGAGIAAAYGVAWLGGKRRLQDLLAYCVPLTLLSWVAAFALFEYYAVRDPYTYGRAIGTQARMVSGETDWPYTRQFVNTAAYWFQLKNLSAWGMGWVLGAAAVGGVVAATIDLLVDGSVSGIGWLRRRGALGRASSLPAVSPPDDGPGVEHKPWLDHPRRAGVVVMLGWALPFFAYTARLEVKFLRYMLPLTPLLCLFAADLVWRFGGHLTQALRPGREGGAGRRATRCVPHWSLPILVLLPTLLWAAAYMRVYAQEHPWQAASRWFYEHAPAGSAYTWEAWGDPLPVDLPDEGLYRQVNGYRDVCMQIYHDMSPQDKVQHLAQSLREADYVVLSTPRLYLSVARLPWRYPVEIRYYQLLFTGRLGYELDQKFTAWPGIGPLEVNDLGADQSFYDYDHPLVLVFHKTRDLTDVEWQMLFAEQLAAEPQVTREGDVPPVRLPVP